MKIYNYLIQIETFGIPFDLKTFFEGDGLNFGHSYYKEDVLDSGFDDLVCWGMTSKKQLRDMVGELVKMGIPKNNINVYSFTKEKV